MSRKRVTSITIETALLTRRLQSGLHLIAPVADRSLVSEGSRATALDTQREFLDEYLISVRPDILVHFATPRDTRLHFVNVVLRRRELPDRVQIDMPVRFACVLIPQKRDAWVIVPSIDHTFYVDRRESLDEAIGREIERVVAANEFSGARYLRLFPAEDTALGRISVTLDHGGEGLQGRAGSLRKKLVSEHRRKQAMETLESVAVPMHERVPNPPPPLIGREREIAQLSPLMADGERRSVLLLGSESSGKSALMNEWVARECSPGTGAPADQPANQPAGPVGGSSDRRVETTAEATAEATVESTAEAEAKARRRPPGRRLVYSTSAAQLLAGMSGFGEWQARVEKVLKAAELLDVVLYFDNLGELFGERSDRGGAGIAGLMRRYVVEGRVRVIGEITSDGLEAAEARHVAFLGAFNRIRVTALDARQTVQALSARIDWWAREQPDRPQVSPEVCTSVVDLAERYLPYRAFPGKAIQFVEELRATANPARDPNGVPVVIDQTRAYDGFSLATGIPAFLLREDRALLAERVIQQFRDRMVGQNEAVRRVVETLCVVKARLQPTGKPLCTFLFIGPTGVGKTELARTLAKFLFKSTERMARFDMSEYTDSMAAERLIRGTQSDDGLLTSKVREQPFCVLLLDEIEKAHPAVFDLLLQVCGEGRLTDARGKTAYFHNAIIIMTSNLGTAHKRGALGIAGRVRCRRPIVTPQPSMRPFGRSSSTASIGSSRSRSSASRKCPQSPASPSSASASDAVSPAPGSDCRSPMMPPLFWPAVATPRPTEYGHCAAIWTITWSRLYPDYWRKSGQRPRVSLVLVNTVATEPQPDGPGAKARIAGEVTGALRFDLYRRSASVGRRALRGVAALAELRRQVDRYMSLERVAAVKERIDLLRSQLATVGGQRRRPSRRQDQDVGALDIEFHRMSKLWNAADRMRQDLQAAEEFGLSALFEGQEADEWAEEADSIFGRFRSELFWLLMARQEARKHITLLVSDVQGAGMHRYWLGPLLRECRAGVGRFRRTCTVRPPRARSGPPERIWMPPRSADWVRTNILDRPSQHRDILLRVRGPDAAVILGLEVGLHRFRGFDPRTDPAAMTVSLVAMRTEFTDKEWLQSVLSERGVAMVSDRGTAARERVRGSDEIRIMGKDRRVHVTMAEYCRGSKRSPWSTCCSSSTAMTTIPTPTTSYTLGPCPDKNPRQPRSRRRGLIRSGQSCRAGVTSACGWTAAASSMWNMSATWPDLLRRLAREPLIHFALIGCLLFALDRACGPATMDSDGQSTTGSDAQSIVIGEATRATLRERFSERTGRVPTSVETRALIDRHVDREVMYREALALGLERGDPIIRRRLIQRLEFLAEDLAARPRPRTTAQLYAFMADHGDRYELPARVTGRHVFMRREHRERVPEVREALLAGADPATVGDPFSRGARFALVSHTRLAATMGDSFADGVMAQPIGSWSQVIESSYGLHLVRVEERTPAGPGTLSALRARVIGDWRAQAHAGAVRTLLDEMRARYRVVETSADGDVLSDGDAPVAEAPVNVARAWSAGLALCAVLALGQRVARAHQFRPVLVQLTERAPGLFAVAFSRDVGPGTGQLEVVLPDLCQTVSAPDTRVEGGVRVTRWTVDCGPDSLLGARIGVHGLSASERSGLWKCASPSRSGSHPVHRPVSGRHCTVSIRPWWSPPARKRALPQTALTGRGSPGCIFSSVCSTSRPVATTCSLCWPCCSWSVSARGDCWRPSLRLPSVTA